MKNIAIKIFSLMLLLSLSLSPVMAKTPAAGTMPEVQSPSRPEPEKVPDEILKEFENGMPIEEFLMKNKGPIPNALMEYANLPVTVIVQLEQPSLISYIKESGGSDRASQQKYVSQLDAAQKALKDQISSKSADAIFMGSYTKVLNGFMARMPFKDLNTVREMPGVRSVTKAPEHKMNLANSVPLIKADEVWGLTPTGYTGDGIEIAIIDTGIDYTHEMFDGSGGYSTNDPDIIETGSFPTAKVIGGYDFAGTAYDASDDDNDIPVPDEDPLDENGHGTHVASTAAGIDAGFGSGVAYDAKLYALKVFGANGSTNLVIDAIEWAMDPNGDDDTADHVDVINMSLGSSFGVADGDDLEYLAVEAANDLGVFLAISAGNEGNHSYITGAPGVSDSAISVAAATTGYEAMPYLAYSNTTEVKVPYQPSSANPFVSKIEGVIKDVDLLDGDGTGLLCDTTGITAGALQDKIALVQRGVCSFYVKIDNAAALGAKAVIVYNSVAGGEELITMATEDGTSRIPAGLIRLTAGLELKGHDGVTVAVGPDDVVEVFVSPIVADTIASFSSRGPRGYDSKLKPEISAPGVAIFAAAMGTTDKGVSYSGTSMAAPHIAGVAALMKEAHPDWTNEEIKAAMMNTAVDLADVAGQQVPRQGAGRVDALAAVETPILAIGDDDLVSLSWGLVEIGPDEIYEDNKMILLVNKSGKDLELTMTSEFTSAHPGATLTHVTTSFIVPANSSVNVDINLVLDADQLPLNYDNPYSEDLEEYYGYVTFSGDADLRLPFYFVPRPYTELTEASTPVTSFEASSFGYVELTQSSAGDELPSSLWFYPVMLTSETNDNVSRAADIRYVGMDYGFFDADYGDIFIPSFAMYGNVHNSQPYISEVDLYIDVNQDGYAEVVDFNYNYAYFTGNAAHTNVWFVAQVDYVQGWITAGSPYLIFTDYNSGFQEWYLPAGWHYITDTFGFDVLSFDYLGRSDYAGHGQFDITKPPFMYGLDPSTLNPVNETFNFLFAIDDLGGYIYSKPEGVMLVDYHGRPGEGQAYYWPLDISYYQLYLPLIFK